MMEPLPAAGSLLPVHESSDLLSHIYTLFHQIHFGVVFFCVFVFFCFVFLTLDLFFSPCRSCLLERPLIPYITLQFMELFSQAREKQIDLFHITHAISMNEHTFFLNNLSAKQYISMIDFKEITVFNHASV